MGSRDTFVRNVNGIAEKIHLLVDIPKNERKRYCVAIKREAV